MPSGCPVVVCPPSPAKYTPWELPASKQRCSGSSLPHRSSRNRVWPLLSFLASPVSLPTLFLFNPNLIFSHFPTRFDFLNQTGDPFAWSALLLTVSKFLTRVSHQSSISRCFGLFHMMTMLGSPRLCRLIVIVTYRPIQSGLPVIGIFISRQCRYLGATYHKSSFNQTPLNQFIDLKIRSA